MIRNRIFFRLNMKKKKDIGKEKKEDQESE